MDSRAALPLHVTYGDALAEKLPAELGDAHVLVVREALREGPLAPDPWEDLAAYVPAPCSCSSASTPTSRATGHLGAARRPPGPLVLRVDAEPCIDCATFLSLEFRSALISCRGHSLPETPLRYAAERLWRRFEGWEP